MRIMKLKEFLKMPEGTVYSLLQPESFVFQDLHIKGTTFSGDYWDADLIGAVEAPGSYQRLDRLLAMENDSKVSFPVDFDGYGRACSELNNPGCHYVVYEAADVKKLIKALGKTLE